MNLEGFLCLEEGNPRCHCYQLDPQGKQIMPIQEANFSGHHVCLWNFYKAYARGENIGDVTAKGESVGNIADLLGTGLSIFISKRNPSLVTSFAFLSCGYLLSSYHELLKLVEVNPSQERQLGGGGGMHARLGTHVAWQLARGELK